MSDVTTTTITADIKSDSEPWSVLENLILAQAIYKCGDTNWVAIARTIKGHPQIHRSSNFFSQKSCAIQYTLLLENLEAETSRSKQTRANDADIPSVVKLAGQLYNQRILEIKALIRKDEERFRALVAELDDIRQGKWDNQLEEELKKNPQPPEVEQKPEATTNEQPTSSAETDQPTQRDDEPLQIDTTAPSSLSSPVLSTLSEKPEDVSQAMNEDVPEVEQPVTSTVFSADGASESQAGNEQKDVEMEEAGEPESTSQTPAVSVPTPVASSNTPVAGNVDEDVEMEDITSTDPPPVMSEAATPVEIIKSTTVQDGGSNLKKAEVDTGSIASSPTSASDLSPPGAMEEEEDEDEEDEDDTPKKDPTPSSPASDNAKGDSEANESDQVKEEESGKEGVDKEADEEEDEEPDKDETADQEMGPDSRDTPDRSSEDGDDSKIDEDVAIKSEDAMNDTEQEEDAAKDGHDEGATSADEEEEEEEEAVTKSPRKPRKIKTSVPVKRKRRSGRSGADVEEGYNSSDSEATESVSNMSDQRNQMDDKKWKKILMMIWTEITNHRYGAVFMQPIKEHDAPGYYLMIKRPMDLKSIKERIRDGQITNADEFHRDVLLMFMNALMYNGEDTEVYQMAMAMMTEVEQIIKNFKSSQSFAPTGTSGGTGGSGNASVSTTPTTRTAGSDVLPGTTSGSSGQPSSRRRKSSGMEMTPVE
ncbi:Bromodomain-containing protein 8 [Haplosporangium gracile]|nr:Bromodomain-containing protein 8 [Haplosporangium gracile]